MRKKEAITAAVRPARSSSSAPPNGGATSLRKNEDRSDGRLTSGVLTLLRHSGRTRAIPYSAALYNRLFLLL
jgi:hypothetical protein